MSGAMNRHCIPGLTIHSGELLCRSVRIIKTMHTGFSIHVLHYAAGADTEETDVMI